MQYGSGFISYSMSFGHNQNWLVVQFHHLEKYEFVNGKDDIPYMMENQTCSKPPTRDITKNWFSTIAERVDYHDTISGLFHSPKSSHADLRR